MLDLFNELTWQFKILVFEGIASGILGIIILGGRTEPWKRTWVYVGFSYLWDAVALALLITGGATTSWQHICYASFFVFSIIGCTKGWVRKQVIEPVANPNLFGFLAFAYAITSVLLLLGGRA